MPDREQRTIAARTLPLLDLTDLSDNCRAVAVDALCRRAVTPHGSVAAVCIWPRYVSDAVRSLAGTGIKIATVINFPHGEDELERAVSDCRETVRDGADEIDLVMPYRAFLAGNTKGPGDLIRAVADEIRDDKILKVILETGALETPDKIAAASELAIASGAHFLKTSTGKFPVSATLAAARIMLDVIQKHGGSIGFKAAGGIRQISDAQAYLELSDHMMGAAWADARHFRFGASGLLETVLARLDGRTNETESRH
jgi:deoxyribose-phosphate aldolase